MSFIFLDCGVTRFGVSEVSEGREFHIKNTHLSLRLRKAFNASVLSTMKYGAKGWEHLIYWSWN